MSHAAVVRYTTRPDTADENEQLIKAVFAQLAEQRPKGGKDQVPLHSAPTRPRRRTRR